MEVLVFVLWCGEFDDRHIVGVFSTRALAEAGQETAIKLGRRLRYGRTYPSDYDIEVWTLDEAPV